ncbi:sulfurtransferase [Coxiella-like endosymbiont of Rhipicephalus sanguineus]|uniref:rhodanese-like domain-containing protein n=1 Tax=Coxiella-like endosymbiont of Rhipicephalus sanguineus TaxID=1955402 RepID=UPI00204260E0|nr:rhodanese-like domain-containing protein [Coxiella-like endosymbiont of Rhipicephalus sanguineus]MBT8506715.1 sulfurtransferase [Coxiella-like endosymbiont of Rhipicephalus sanguineus]
MKKLLQFFINHWLLVTAFIIALIALFILEARSKGLGGNNRLTPFKAVWFINNEKAVVIDIRDPKTFEKGHITHAVNIPATEFDKSLKGLEQYKEQPLIIVCGMGQKSPYFVNKLRKQGYQKVYMLAGGIGAWFNANMPVVK